MDPSIQDLIDISHYAARHPSWVQGGGGNCSVKARGRMFIKASGFFLEELAEDNGYSILDLATKQPAENNRLKPSMEFPLHTLLGNYVIHTHPSAAGALVCAGEGKAEFRKIFPEPHFIWVDYANPGLNLFLKVRETLAGLPQPVPEDKMLFLQNHGLFAAAAAKKRCMELHDEAIARCEKALPFKPEAVKKSGSASGNYLTPDHVVFNNMGHEGLSPKQQQALSELDAFAAEVEARIRAKGWSPCFLAPADVKFLLQMEEEKYRQDLWKKNI